jgi:hypothetical protein
MNINASNDWIVRLHIKEIIPKNKLLPTDFYWEQGRMVMTESYHKRRGSCCANGCLHCPYEPKHKKGNVVLNIK